MANSEITRAGEDNFREGSTTSVENPNQAILKEITREESIKTIAELIDLYEVLHQWSFNKYQLPDFREANLRGFNLAYRGQSQAFGTLIPSFQRQFNQQFRGAATLIELRMIRDFRDHYGRLPQANDDMPQSHQIAAGHDLRCLSVMQHYEIPTRLLDWTTDFWIALYFACGSDPGQPAELWFYDRGLFQAQRGADVKLQAFLDQEPKPQDEPEFLGRLNDDLLVEVDPQISPRMRHQFAHHTISTSVFSDHVPALFSLQSSQGGIKGSENRVLIDANCKGKTLQFLAENVGITASTIFPDVVGLGRYLRWQFDSLRTMMLLSHRAWLFLFSTEVIRRDTSFGVELRLCV